MNDTKREKIQVLRDALGGEGEFLPDAPLEYLWGAFSGYMCASWLIPDELMVGNFAAWLVACVLDGKVLDGRRTAPWGAPFSEIPRGEP